MAIIRRGEASDLAQIAVIQEFSPEAPRWPPADYLQYDLLVAERDNRVAGFLASRTVTPGEREILNLAVSPEFRRQGIARCLWGGLVQISTGSIYLEVRESNQAARNLYLSLGFQEVGCRLSYYDNPPEAAIVMKFHSC